MIPEDAVNDESEDEDKVDKDERLPQSDRVCLFICSESLI